MMIFREKNTPYNFYFRIQGLSSAPRLLFLHGFMGDGADFNEAIAQLQTRFCCMTVDLPGHGHTIGQSTASYGMSAVAAGIKRLLEAESFWPCGLIGYSMGGRLALYLAMHYPDYFGRTMLISASPGLASEAEQIQRRQHDERLAQSLELEIWPVFLAYWYQQPQFATLRQHPSFEKILQKRRQNNPRELARSLREMGTGQQPSLWRALSQLKSPLNLLVGQSDPKFLDINQRMLQLMPHAELTVVGQCGHTVHIEQRLFFVEQVAHFFTP